MIKITYFAQNDPEKSAAPYWQVGYLNPQDRYHFIPVTPYRHYSKHDSHELADLINEAVKRYVDINEIPAGDSNDLLGVNTIDPNDETESQKSLDILSSWLSTTERLHEHMKGSLIEKVNELKEIMINLLEAVGNVDVQKDSLGNWRAFKKDS